MTTEQQIYENVISLIDEFSQIQRKAIAETQNFMRDILKDDKLIFDYTKQIICMSEESMFEFPVFVKVRRVPKNNWKMTGHDANTIFIMDDVFLIDK